MWGSHLLPSLRRPMNGIVELVCYYDSPLHSSCVERQPARDFIIIAPVIIIGSTDDSRIKGKHFGGSRSFSSNLFTGGIIASCCCCCTNDRRSGKNKSQWLKWLIELTTGFIVRELIVLIPRYLFTCVQDVELSGGCHRVTKKNKGYWAVVKSDLQFGGDSEGQSGNYWTSVAGS